VRPKSQLSWLNLSHWPMFSTSETSVHVRDKNREISPLEREEGYRGKEEGYGGKATTWSRAINGRHILYRNWTSKT